MNLSPIIGITTASGPYQAMAQKAAATFRAATGCQSLVLACDEERSYAMKFALPDVAPDRVKVFFDADTRWLGTVDVRRFQNFEGLAAVLDPSRFDDTSFCGPDADTLGFPRDQYVNTGVMVIGKGRRVAEAFDQARTIMEARMRGLGPEIQDVTEQSILNQAFHLARLDVMHLGDEWNFWPHAVARGWMRWPPVQYCLHAAGIPLARKTAFLDKHQEVLDPNSPLSR